ncbi:hypothetical protein PDIG_21500 [Penicillium digitatum PHI26]|uniref:Uncharacterized protein n=2 Tax=Penicillium digitatum TaxID=36651 RepID=K9GSV2_PEND2|nr:hypothetical protein PDIP_23780 [Penicillium digitatum Pd1]EKV16171.1 hypothetical protein PDIG_21500 [Penicillium digitatum PHI26]EKV19368.1 hypothetical protein PDIP_23780 [Penicillium digitatum Pd1]
MDSTIPSSQTIKQIGLARVIIGLLLSYFSVRCLRSPRILEQQWQMVCGFCCGDLSHEFDTVSTSDHVAH